jgi:hypothetical protein
VKFLRRFFEKSCEHEWKRGYVFDEENNFADVYAWFCTKCSEKVQILLPRFGKEDAMHNDINDKLSNFKFHLERTVHPGEDLDHLLGMLDEIRDEASEITSKNRELQETIEKITPAIMEVSDPEHFDCEVQGGLDDVREILDNLSKCQAKGTLTKVTK